MGGVCLIMVKLIPTHKRQLLANFEVLEILNQHQVSEKEKAKNKRKPVKSGKFSKSSGFSRVNFENYFYNILINGRKSSELNRYCPV